MKIDWIRKFQISKKFPNKNSEICRILYLEFPKSFPFPFLLLIPAKSLNRKVSKSISPNYSCLFSRNICTWKCIRIINYWYKYRVWILKINGNIVRFLSRQISKAAFLLFEPFPNHTFSLGTLFVDHCQEWIFCPHLFRVLVQAKLIFNKFQVNYRDLRGLIFNREQL